MNKKEFGKVMFFLIGAYPNTKIDDGTIDAWYESFNKYDLDCFNKAVKQHVDTAIWFPAIADIKNRINKNSLPFQDALLAWENIITTINRNKKPKFDDVTEQTIRQIGGYGKICDQPLDTMQFLKKEFTENYNLNLNRVKDGLLIGNIHPEYKELTSTATQIAKDPYEIIKKKK